MRYFDGTAWSHHVADNGVQSIDQVAPAPDSTSAVASMQPSSKVVLWEGCKTSLGSMATGGAVTTAKYRITEDALVFEAGLLSRKEEVIPLWAVMDVDLRQSMTQKPRDVGDLNVRLDPAGAKYGQQFVLLESVRDPRGVRQILSAQANSMRAAMLDRQHSRDIERRQAGAMNISIGGSGLVAPPEPTQGVVGAAPSQAPTVMDQIRQLGELHASGILTDDEFQQKKAELLSRL